MNIIPIQNPLDITSARNMLRKKITGGMWLLPFRARAAITLTLMGELILHSGQPGTLAISVLSKPNTWGIEIDCTYVDNGQFDTGTKHQQLAQMVDVLDVTTKDGHTNLKSTIWLS